MTNKKEIIASIIIIGNEVLSGRTKDLNTSAISMWLNSIGISVKEVRVIPDIEKIIVATVNELRKFASMTVRQAREVVKNEFESTRRWEDGEE